MRLIEKLAGENGDSGMAATLAPIAVRTLELLVDRASGDMLGDGERGVVDGTRVARKSAITVAEVDALVLESVGRGVVGAVAAGEGAVPTWEGGTTFTATAVALAMGRSV